MKARARLGQNFLVDTQAVDRIVAALGNLDGRTVVEIGPGRGAITASLATRAGQVLAVEFDGKLAAQLRRQFPPDRVLVVEKDILDFDLPAVGAQLSASVPGARLRVVGNLPYYITSPILFALAASHAVLDLAVLMVQREVADRVLASPGSRDYGSLTVTAQMYGSVERLFSLPPSAFSPPPEVHSTVFRWRFAPRFDELGVNEDSFLRLVRTTFAQKRKTLVNNLRVAGFETAAATAALAAAGISPQARAEAVSIEGFAAIWRHLHSKDAGLSPPPAGHAVR